MTTTQAQTIQDAKATRNVARRTYMAVATSGTASQDEREAAGKAWEIAREHYLSIKRAQ